MKPSHFLSAGEKIQDIAKRVAVGFVKFGITTARAGNRCKFDILNIENFCQKTAGCADFR